MSALLYRGPAWVHIQSWTTKGRCLNFRTRRDCMGTPKYDKFADLDPFFAIVMKGLEGLVDGHHSGTPWPLMRSSSSVTVSQVGPNASRAGPRI